MQTVLPETDHHPYYIHAPGYAQTSAGIRVLHLLCHLLNRKGYRAYIAPIPGRGQAVHPDLLTPHLTPALASHHAQQGLCPIAVYPEIVKGNPLNAGCTLRYVLNVPGVLGGETQYAQDELIWTYSQQLANLCERHDGVLHMPVIDQSVFHPDPDQPRSGSVFYAAKYQKEHKQKVFGLPPGAIEITRNEPDSQTPAQIAQLLQKAEAFYCFENTALATEAVLCGCPAVFMPNHTLEKPIALQELGWDGYAWGNEEAEIERARRTVPQGQANFQRTVSEFFEQLETFVEMSQERAAKAIPPSKAGTLSVADPNEIMHVRDVAKAIRTHTGWRFNDWFRLVRALNRVAFRALLRFGRPK